MHSPSHGREHTDRQVPLPPAIRDAADPAVQDPAATGALLGPFTGWEPGHEPPGDPDAFDSPEPATPDAGAGSVLDTGAADAAVPEPEMDADGTVEDVEPADIEVLPIELEADAPEPEATMAEQDSEPDAPGSEQAEAADAPWDALGRAIDDALMRAAEAAEPPSADWAMRGIAELAPEDLAVLDGDELEPETNADSPGAADAEAVTLAVDGASVTDDAGPQTGTAAPAAAAIDAGTEGAAGAGAADAAGAGTMGADDLAARLESLATRLRLEGPEALEDAIASGDRTEAVLAAALAALRKAGVFGAPSPTP